eukprot:878574-Amphidinium_carterae.1
MWASVSGSLGHHAPTHVADAAGIHSVVHRVVASTEAVSLLELHSLHGVCRRVPGCADAEFLHPHASTCSSFLPGHIGHRVLPLTLPVTFVVKRYAQHVDVELYSMYEIPYELPHAFMREISS